MNRKQRRAMKKQMKKQGDVEDELTDKMLMFDQLPDECSACVKPFDKKDREQVENWSVVVRKDANEVRLYCPECWQKALTIVEEFRQHLESKNANSVQES